MKKTLKSSKVDEAGTDAIHNSTSKTEKTLRGRTRMHCLAVQRVNGVKKLVDFNELGQPIGTVASQMQSYIGVLAREKVRITFNRWTNVPKEVKDLIWESVNLSFNVDPRWRVECLKSANNKWRQFKAELTTHYIFKRLDSPDLNDPPSKYRFINPSDWTTFLLSRLTDNFKGFRKKQQDRRDSSVYPYRLSRKGYAKYAAENPSLVSNDIEVTQATLWVEGRKSKGGIHEGDGLKEKVAKIGEFIAQKQSGSLTSANLGGSILDTVLDKDEHGGFVRGIGGHAYKTTINRVPGVVKSSESNNDQLAELVKVKKRSAEQDERIAKLEAIVFKKSECEEISSCSVHKPEMKTEDDDGIELLDTNSQYLGKLVELKLESGPEIVGYGTVVKVHGRDDNLDANCMRITIDEALLEDANLPIPTDDCQSIGEGVGSHVFWPIHLLKLKDEKSKRQKIQEQTEPAIDLSSVPKELRMMYKYCKVLGRSTIKLILDDDIFNFKRVIYIHLQDVEPFCQLQPISYNCIAVYIWFLFIRIKELKKEAKYRFVDPYVIGHIPSTKNDKQSVDERSKRRSTELAARLGGTLLNQLVFAPCNVGEHWILTIIDPHKEEVAIMDPLYKGIRDGVWKQVVNVALKIFGAQKQQNKRKTPKWIIINGPKQPDGFQCGYYVMRYMRDIIEANGGETISSLQSLFSNRYSSEDIDVVRKEWAEFIQDHL